MRESFFSIVFVAIVVLVFSPICGAQTVTIDIGKPINDVIDSYEQQIRDALEEQVQKIGGIKDQAINSAVESATNPYKGQWEACMKSFQKCAQKISEVDLCPRSKAKAPEMPTHREENSDASEEEAMQNYQNQMNCPDGSQPDYQAMAQAAQSCKVPSNCNTIAQKYMAGAMAGSIAGGYVKNFGTSLLSGALSHIPGMPKIPLLP